MFDGRALLSVALHRACSALAEEDGVCALYVPCAMRRALIRALA